MGYMRKAAFAFLAIAAAGMAASASAQPAPEVHHEIPQSQALEHQENLDRLTALSGHPGKVGEIARKAVDMFKAHNAREVDYILPPLVLLPLLADGKVTPDMQWALDMADKVKANREAIFEEHAGMIEVLNELQLAGQQAHDEEAIDFARGAATDALNDVEILEPTVMMIGEVLHARLAPAH
jgi:hypothetical protein